MSQTPANQSFPTRLKQLLKFCLVGGSGVVVDMLVIHFLADPGWLGWNVTPAKVCSTEAALLNNFLWNELWTFRALTENGAAKSSVWRRLLKFHAICGVGMLWAICLINLFYHGMGMNLYLANGLAIVLVTFWNFWLNAKYNWKTRKSELSDTPPVTE